MTMIMACLSLGFTAFAETLNYDVWVNGEQFDETKLSISCGDGTAEYDPENQVLTLTNAYINKGYEYQPWYKAAIYSKLDNLTIVLNGFNEIMLEGDTETDGIDAAPGCNISIEGGDMSSMFYIGDVDGSDVITPIDSSEEENADFGFLSIYGGYYGTYIGSFEAEGGNLSFKDCMVWVSGTEAAGIWVNHDITLDTAFVYVYRQDKSSYNGIVSNVDGTISLNNNSALVSVNKTSAILLGNTDSSSHNITVDGGSAIQVMSETGYGIEVVPYNESNEIKGNLQILDGVIVAQTVGDKPCTNLSKDQITIAEDKELYTYLGGLTTSDDTIVKTVKPYKGFPDVNENAWYYEAAKFNAQFGYISGYQNGKFGPGDNIKRQDFAIVLANFNGVDLSEYVSDEPTKFSDVAPNAYYAPAVRWASENGYVSCYANGKFGVGDNITREQICTIFFRYFTDGELEEGFDADAILAPFTTDGKKVSSWAKDGVAWCIDNGVISGKNSTTIAPTANASRAEAAQIFMNVDKMNILTALLDPEIFEQE